MTARRLPPNTIKDPVAYLLGRTDRTGDCWLWTGGIQPAGYGIWPRSAARRFGLSTLAHRALYVLLVGPVPDGLQLDHLCRTRRCVNPAHLEPVTGRINSLRGEGPAAMNARKDRCVNGHPFDEANTYVHRDAAGVERRQCRACNAESQRRSQMRASA